MIAWLHLALLLGTPPLDRGDADLRCSILVGGAFGSRPTGLALTQRTVQRADAIVRATAVQELRRPDADSVRRIEPPTTVRFRVLEVIWGADVPAEFEVAGTLDGGDEFNRDTVPYLEPRSSALVGMCFSYRYRAAGEYALLLRREHDGRYTPYWEPLQPVNEQVRGPDDPWIVWLRSEMRRLQRR